MTRAVRTCRRWRHHVWWPAAIQPMRWSGATVLENELHRVRRADVANAVCPKVKSVGEPDAGNPHVRFDERGAETEREPYGSQLPRLSSTPFLQATVEARARHSAKTAS
jgi:hypothetical protein